MQCGVMAVLCNGSMVWCSVVWWQCDKNNDIAYKQTSIDQILGSMSEWLYKNLNTDIDILWKTNIIHKHKKQNAVPNTFYTYVWNSSDVTFDNAETWILKFGLNCNFENPMKYFTFNWHWQCHYTPCCKITQYI
jgi:hypothetical protein